MDRNRFDAGARGEFVQGHAGMRPQCLQSAADRLVELEIHPYRFAGQHRFHHAQVNRFQQPGVGRDGVDERAHGPVRGRRPAERGGARADDARDILEFTNALLEYVFTFRDRFEAFKIRREQRLVT